MSKTYLSAFVHVDQE